MKVGDYVRVKHTKGLFVLMGSLFLFRQEIIIIVFQEWIMPRSTSA